MRQDLYIEYDRGMTRAALCEDGALAEFYVESDQRERLMGNIYKGRVQNVLKGMQAAFVDIGLDRNAFLYLGDTEIAAPDFEPAEGEAPLPRPQPVRPGQELVVQIIKEMEGQKGPRITTQITLPGRLMVLAPRLHMVGVSRRIENAAERARLRAEALRARPEGMGVIARTAAEGAPGSDMREDVEALLQQWAFIEEQAAALSAPCLLHREEPLYLRLLRDMSSENVGDVWLNDPGQHAQAVALAGRVAPGLKERIRRFSGPGFLLDWAGLHDAARELLNRRVWLGCGGYLVIDQTEALTVIDVNTGKFVGSTNLQDTVFRTNLEAAREIARQLRLRDIGGIIVIDFIDMDDPSRRAKLLEALGEALKKDRNKTNVAGLTSLGLVEMTRKKMRRRLSAQLQRACLVCQGEGQVLADEFVARDALRQIDRMRQSGYAGELWLEAGPAVCQRVRELRQGADLRVRETELPDPQQFHIRPFVPEGRGTGG